MAELEPVRIDDYRRPWLPLPVRVLNGAAGPFARRLFPLDPASLLLCARKRTGLSDFGDDGFREPFERLLWAFENEAGLTAFGRMLTRQLMLQLLETRLRMQALITQHPEIEGERIEAPIVIMGLPRTGTTHLHNLISQDPELHSLSYWESLEPVPPAAFLRSGRTAAEASTSSRFPLRGSRSSLADPNARDPRFERCERALKFVHYVMPLFPLMHEMTADARHEEIQLLAVEFSTMLFEASYLVPSYRDWYRATDQGRAYATLKRLLQIVQWHRGGGGRWVLKSPQHLEQIGPLLEVFPDAKIVQTHRDPVRVTASYCTLGAYSLRMNSGAVDPIEVGRYWAERIEAMLRASIEDRPRIPEDQIFDMRFHDFMADDVAMVERIYAFADQPMNSAAQGAMRAYMDANPRGKHGTVRYLLEDFGIDPEERRRALRFYQERFDLPDE